MFITMLCWGSWGNAAKMDKTWRFELFYWDYSIGVLLTGIFFAFIFGNLGSEGQSFFANLTSAGASSMIEAIFSGVIFNIANILLVAAISIAAMAVAFPIGIGIALVAGTVFSYFVSPQGNPFFLFLGVVLVLAAVLFDAVAYRRKELEESGSVHTSKKGIAISIVSGILMSLFYPIIADSMQGPTGLTPYTAIFFFVIGVFVCNWFVNAILMKTPISGSPLSMSMYFKGTVLQHGIGILGGVIWCVGMTLNIIASINAGPAIAYAFGQGATLIAAIWGVFIWREFAGAKSTYALLFLMFICYALGLVSIGIAKLV